MTKSTTSIHDLKTIELEQIWNDNFIREFMFGQNEEHCDIMVMTKSGLEIYGK